MATAKWTWDRTRHNPKVVFHMDSGSDAPVMKVNDTEVTLYDPDTETYNSAHYHVVDISSTSNGSQWLITGPADSSVSSSAVWEIADSLSSILPINVTGTITSATETDIKNGGKTIILTCQGDETWVATVGSDNAITTALIAGIDSAQSEASGWDAVVKANMVYTDVTRTSDTVVTITLGSESTYSITDNETITITVPASAVTGAVETSVNNTFTITADAATVNQPQQIIFY